MIAAKLPQICLYNLSAPYFLQDEFMIINRVISDGSEEKIQMGHSCHT